MEQNGIIYKENFIYVYIKIYFFNARSFFDSLKTLQYSNIYLKKQKQKIGVFQIFTKIVINNFNDYIQLVKNNVVNFISVL